MQAVSADTAAAAIGMPEANVVVGQCVAYLALAPKSTAVYKAVAAVEKQIRTAPNAPVPLVIRNAPTGMMKDQGNGDGYIYPPDHGYPVKPQAYLPDELVGTRFLPNERQCPMIARALARCADAPDSVLDGHLTFKKCVCWCRDGGARG